MENVLTVIMRKSKKAMLFSVIVLTAIILFLIYIFLAYNKIMH